MTPPERQEFINSLTQEGINHQTAANLVDTILNHQGQIDDLTARLDALTARVDAVRQGGKR
jgi:hypothetical protein